MVLEAVALEILHGIGLAVGGADLLELLADRIAEDGQTAVGGPILQERPAEVNEALISFADGAR